MWLFLTSFDFSTQINTLFFKPKLIGVTLLLQIFYYEKCDVLRLNLCFECIYFIIVLNKKDKTFVCCQNSTNN